MSKLKLQSVSFHRLHLTYHERDFRVRVNDFTIEAVKKALAYEVGRDPDSSPNCPACAEGHTLDFSENFLDAAYAGTSA